MQVNYDERKLTELLLYIAERLLPDTSGGATKLNKVLYVEQVAAELDHPVDEGFGRARSTQRNQGLSQGSVGQSFIGTP